MKPGDHDAARTAAAVGAWRGDLALIAVPALATFAFALFSPYIFADGDTNWQVAAGRWILAHGAVPTTDVFSYSNAGRPWVTHEWLSEALLGLAYNVAGWTGVVMLTGAAAAAAVALLATELRRWLAPLSVIACIGMTLTLLMVHILPRPHIIALPLIVLWTVQMLRARRLDRTPSLWLLPVMVLWANLHGSYVFGLAFSAFFALEAFIGAGGRRLMVGARWGAFLAAAAAVALLTPNGVSGLIHPVEVMAMKDLPWITEWTPASFAAPSTLEFVLLVALFACLYRGVRMPAVRLSLLLLLVYMTLQHIRQEVILAVIGPLLLAEPLGRALEPDTQTPRPSTAWPAFRRIAPPLALAAAGFLALGAWRLASPVVRVDRDLVPVTALAHVPPALRAQPVFNDYSMGGWLIFEGVRPFIDGRADMYGDDFLTLYVRANRAEPAAVETVFSRYHVAWTILQPASPLVARLDATPGWRRLYADKWAVVQVRSDALPARPGARAYAAASRTIGRR